MRFLVMGWDGRRRLLRRGGNRSTDSSNALTPPRIFFHVALAVITAGNLHIRSLKYIFIKGNNNIAIRGSTKYLLETYIGHR